eukprot:9885420-Alexandrium_andersonii.AAC.1
MARGAVDLSARRGLGPTERRTVGRRAPKPLSAGGWMSRRGASARLPRPAMSAGWLAMAPCPP